MRRFFQDRELYSQMIRITLPIAVQNFIIFAVSMADTVMVGTLGEVPFAAVSLANQVTFVFNLFTFGLGSGANVMIAQFWGKRDNDSIHKVMTIMYRFLMVGQLVFFLFCTLAPGAVMSIFSKEAEVVSIGASYLQIIGVTYLIAGITTTSMFVLRSVGTVKISMVVYSASLVVNVFFNWVLIFGNLGAPRLEVVGAAIATAIARLVEFVIVLIYMLRVETQIRYRLRYMVRRKLQVLGDFTKNSLPVVVNEILWGSGSAVIAVIIGHMGTEFTAAYSVCNVMGQLVTITIFGAGNAAAVIIGNTVGAGQYDLARKRAKSFLLVSLGMGLVSMCMVLLLKGPLIGFYNISDTARAYANEITTLYAFVVLFQSFCCIGMIGVLRGGGDSRFVMFADLIFMWTLCIPLGAMGGLKFGWPVALVYLVLKSDEVWKTIASLVRIARGNWVKDVTKTVA